MVDFPRLSHIISLTTWIYIPVVFVVMVTIQELKLCFNVASTHSIVEDIYIPFLGNVMDYIFSLLYIILQMYQTCNIVVIVSLNFYLICLTCYVPKWNVLLITWAIGICLIYICPCTRACGPWVWAYISGKSLLPML